MVSRYEAAYGGPTEPNPAGAAKPVQGAVEATSFLLSPPQWLKDAGEAAIAAEHARLGEPGPAKGPDLVKGSAPEAVAPTPTQTQLPTPPVAGRGDPGRPGGVPAGAGSGRRSVDPAARRVHHPGGLR